jgi:hypothetical protein
MPAPRQPADKPAMQKPQDIANIIYGLAAIVNGCFTPFLRSGFGSRGFASHPISLILMIAYGGFANCPEMSLDIPAWLMFVIMRQMKTNKRQHSRYQGYPWLCRIITRNEYQARMIEPWVVFGMGICLTNAAPALGQFLIIGCASLFVTLCIETASIQARKRAMEDARHEAEQMKDLMKGGDGWGD